MSRSRAERVERERLSGRRRVNVARVITSLPPPFPPLRRSLSLFSSHDALGLSSHHTYSLSPSFSSISFYSSLTRVRVALSRLRFYSLLSRFPLSSIHLRLALRFHPVRTTPFAPRAVSAEAFLPPVPDPFPIARARPPVQTAFNLSRTPDADDIMILSKYRYAGTGSSIFLDTLKISR